MSAETRRLRPRAERRGRDKFAKAQPIFDVGVALLELLPRSLVSAVLVGLRNVPGYAGLGLRYMCVKRLAASCGANVGIYTGVHLHNLESLHLGSNVKIGEMCFIGASGGVHIGDDVSLAHATTVLTEEHDYTQRGPLRDTDVVQRPVTVGRGSWIGAGVRVLSGVSIGEGAAIGAGSVVTKDVPDEAVAAGVPARVIRRRGEARP